MLLQSSGGCRNRLLQLTRSRRVRKPKFPLLRPLGWPEGLLEEWRGGRPTASDRQSARRRDVRRPGSVRHAAPSRPRSWPRRRWPTPLKRSPRRLWRHGRWSSKVNRGDWLPAGIEVVPQAGGGLGDRLAAAFATAPRSGSADRHGHAAGHPRTLEDGAGPCSSARAPTPSSDYVPTVDTGRSVSTVDVTGVFDGSADERAGHR